MADRGIDIQRGIVTANADEVPQICDKLVELYGTQNFIVKSQVLAGGRGKGTFDTGFKGGVKFSKTKDDATANAKAMLGNKLVTNQTGADGVKVQKIFVTECLDIKRELYFAILLDRESGGPVLVGSTEGGVEIEQVAKERPDAIIKQPISIKKGIVESDVEEFVKKLGFQGPAIANAKDVVIKLYNMAKELDVTQLEINPWVESPDGRVCCLDAKLAFDDSAEYRQKEVFAFRDFDEMDPRDRQAHEQDLQYIGLTGDIGCLVNGAGLAMATMDIIKLKGGDPANFLDLGGGAQKHQVVSAFKILNSDPNLKGILVNIFGGIVDCSMVAQGIIDAIQEVGLKYPCVVRLSGTRADLGAKMMKDSGLNVHPASDMNEAAEKIVSLSHK
eukprot:NODE_1593_length_1362_cov_21.879665_g1321_i0.p1 GENE.NODE_1593_length_1362_cov_21.879665_g1321_i0~~NODE_1593_length_1362_cov_21.879665_g1321_i0.p1  ORF type:complete len:388 (-),score=117.60 NODE_1593_length_1362_cov_21.879665_g1321_i0:87-1250(-)